MLQQIITNKINSTTPFQIITHLLLFKWWRISTENSPSILPPVLVMIQQIINLEHVLDHINRHWIINLIIPIKKNKLKRDALANWRELLSIIQSRTLSSLEPIKVTTINRVYLMMWGWRSCMNLKIIVSRMKI